MCWLAALRRDRRSRRASISRSRWSALTGSHLMGLGVTEPIPAPDSLGGRHRIIHCFPQKKRYKPRESDSLSGMILLRLCVSSPKRQHTGRRCTRAREWKQPLSPGSAEPIPANEAKRWAIRRHNSHVQRRQQQGTPPLEGGHARYPAFRPPRKRVLAPPTGALPS